MIHAAQRADWQVAGLLSLPELKGSEKIGIWAQDLRSGKKRLLASVKRQAKNDLIFGKWFFNSHTLVWGKKVLNTSIPCDLLVVDELGPLELKLSLGWTNALDVIRSGQYRLALVVIRPELMEMVKLIFNPDQVITLSMVDEVPGKVLQYSTLFGE